MSLVKGITTYFWPVICGLLIAGIIFLAAPNLLAPNNSSTSDADLSSAISNTDISGPVSYSAAVRRAAPSVVYIYTSRTIPAQPGPFGNSPTYQNLFSNLGTYRLGTQEETNLGTGVIVSQEGYVMTNEHVIGSADKIVVALNDGRTSEAQIVGTDSVTDLAVLKIDLNNLTAINTGDPNAAQVGDVVLAIGNAEGLQQTVTQGILSAKGRNLSVGTYNDVDFLQTDAAINQGNSGGPLVDTSGDMIGINSRRVDRDGSIGLSFAIPSDIVLKVFRDIAEYGKVIRGWLGFEADIWPLSADAAAMFGFDQALVVRTLFPGGPAHRAGLQVGDIITKINGEDLSNIRAASRAVANSAPDSRIDFEVIRGNQTVALTILVGLEPESLASN